MTGTTRIMVARPVAPHLAVIKTPLRVRAWEQALVQHPDGEFVRFVLRGIAGGFRIGFNYKRFSCKPAHSNMKLAAENADVVEEYPFTEQSAGRVIGPLAPETVPFVQISPLGVIPKSKPGKWQLTVDLSSPEGASMNDGISKELCSLFYVGTRCSSCSSSSVYGFPPTIFAWLGCFRSQFPTPN